MISTHPKRAYSPVTDHGEAVPKGDELSRSISYIPYGEIFVEESDNKGVPPYRFNAKELDEETGLYYYGARYLDPTSVGWLSVDPMWEKNIGASPYNYCHGNPVKLVDYQGMDDEVSTSIRGIRILLLFSSEKFMGITNVRYTAGNPGRAGGTFKFSGPFDGTVLNNLWGSDPFNRDVYLRSSENGKVLPMFLYERGKSSYNRITGGQSLIEIECYTNPTVK